MVNMEGCGWRVDARESRKQYETSFLNLLMLPISNLPEGRQKGLPRIRPEFRWKSAKDRPRWLEHGFSTNQASVAELPWKYQRIRNQHEIADRVLINNKTEINGYNP
jgi:hypothetical protein